MRLPLKQLGAGSIPVKGTNNMLGFLSLLTPRNIMLPVALVAATAASLYVWSSQRTIKSLRADVVTLEVTKSQLESAIATQKNTIDFLQNQSKLIQQEFEETERAFAQIRRDAENLKEQLKTTELDKLSIDSPSAAEISVNSTTVLFDRCFELLSGAPLNEQEKAAKTGAELNSMCPWIFDDIIR